MNTNITSITRKDEEKFLKLKFADNGVFEKPVTFDDLIFAIENGKLPLEITDDDGTKVIDDSGIEEIKKVIPCLLKIVDKPRSFIKSSEEKMPVETAKRINYKAISKLSRDSNDWYARTVLSIKPKNIVSDINEETIDLYENRFICSLINRISKILADVRRSYQDQIKKIDDKFAINAMNSEYNKYNANSLKFYNKLSFRKMYPNDQDSDYVKKVEIELESIIHAEKIISLMKRSIFYRTLCKKRKVSDPIQKTNILMFEYNYNQAYKLWKYLNQNNHDKTLDLDAEFDKEELNSYYKLYSLICVFSVLYDLNFVETTGGKLFFDRDKREIHLEPLLFRRGNNAIKVLFVNDSIKCMLTTIKKKFTDTFYFCPDFVDFESMNRSAVDDFTEHLLNDMVADKYESSGKYALVSIDLNRCSENNSYLKKVYRRFFSMGNNFDPDETKDNLEKWGGYKAGIAIVSPVQLRNNFLRIEKIFNYYLLKHISIKGTLTTCPLCGGTNIRKNDSMNYTCYDCSHNISVTYCNHCDPKHEKPIVWVKYMNDKFLEQQEVVRGLSNMSIYYRLSKIETIMGERATTAFELEEETNGWKLKTICPYCGVVLGDKEK